VTARLTGRVLGRLDEEKILNSGEFRPLGNPKISGPPEERRRGARGLHDRAMGRLFIRPVHVGVAAWALLGGMLKRWGVAHSCPQAWQTASMRRV